MKDLFAVLTVCLLVSLLLILATDAGRGGCPSMLTTLDQVTSRLQGGEWATPSIWSNSAPRFRSHIGEVRWEFVLKKWRWRNTPYYPKWVRLDSN